MKYENAELRNLLAAEYALGTLRGRARRRLEKIAGKDAAMRADITFWEARLDDFNHDLVPVAPPAAVWLGVEHRLRVAPPRITPIRATERKPVKMPEASAKPASMWRIVAGLASAAAVVLAVLVGQRIPLPGEAPSAEQPPFAQNTTPAPVVAVAPSAKSTYVALLKLPDATLQWTLSLAPERGRVNIAASGEYAKLGHHSLELWVITAEGPVALGVLPTNGTMTLTLPPNLEPGETLTLAVSLEPVGGSPTGKPTGPVLTSGAAVKAA